MKPQTKLKVVPDAAVTSRQQKEIDKINRANKRRKLGTYVDLKSGHPVLKMNEISQRGTKRIEDVPPPLTFMGMVKLWWRS